jgi:hypothetical protein
MATFRLSKETRDALSEARSALEQDLLDQRDAFDERSDRWRESDAGTNVEAWLDELGSLVGDLEDVPWEPQL